MGAAEPARRLTKPLLIGEAPSKSVYDETGVLMSNFPLCGAVCTTLLKILEMDDAVEVSTASAVPFWRQRYWHLVERFELENAFDEPLGAHMGWFAWQTQLGRKERQFPDSIVVLLGSTLRGVVMPKDPKWFVWQPWRSWVVTSIPHPSGLNRLYNEELIRNRACRTLEQAEVMAQEDVTVEFRPDGTMVMSMPRTIGGF